MNKTTTLTKINESQKIMLADIMVEHPNLSRNVLPNCAEGRAKAIRLWNELASKLNSVGPPVKDVKSWQKVYADQKSQATTGGRPIKEELLTHDEEQIVEASGLKIKANENENENLETFTSNQPDSKENILTSKTENIEDEDELIHSSDDSFELPPSSKKQKKDTKSDIELQIDASFKLNRMLDIEKRILQMKEEKHEATLAVQKVDLKIKSLKFAILESLRASTLENNREQL